ncbi:galactokinase [uncultured Polaribacter sp.]|uniref:galactokinase n=1 Tax=uncultured Polaribacter sp. TaxID=174711 RepID=UPI00262C855C|nr:galactokinase [uncultured Polaribacter sp.]
MNLIIQEAKQTYINTFKNEPILVFSPGRINIIGEHTDYNGGFVFPAAVDLGIVVAIGKSNTNKSNAIALDINSNITFDLNNLKPSKEASWVNYVFGVIAELQKEKKHLDNFNIVVKGNIPAGSGMSSSAALENGFVFGLNELFSLGLSKTEMIFISQKAEHNFVGVKCGIMDQYASMFGVKNNVLLLDCKTIKAKSYEIDFKNHQFVLINTNVKHSLADSAYNDRRAACEKVAKLLNVTTLREVTEKDLQKIEAVITPENYQKALYVIQEIERTQKAAKAIENNDLEELGKLIYASHNGLQNQYKVSCKELDFLVDHAKKDNNVLGARMMGGGFGGCTINLIENNGTAPFIATISKAYKKEFNKDCTVYFVKLATGTHLVE